MDPSRLPFMFLDASEFYIFANGFEIAKKKLLSCHLLKVRLEKNYKEAKYLSAYIRLNVLIKLYKNTGVLLYEKFRVEIL